MKWQLDNFTDKDIVFVGRGQGRSASGVETFLKKHAKVKSFQAVDKQTNDVPLDFLKQYDASRTKFIKNEAIPGSEMPVPYITTMQLFFELQQQIGATTIGITGTKGKSTTASLTAHVLRATGKDVYLAGNIGASPFTFLDTADKDSIFVLELSSYQLSDLKRSPQISACINLYNDHTDWHGSLKSYWEAKHNIMRFANENDLFVYNPAFHELVEWAKSATCQTVAINPEDSLDLSKAQLFGDHNRLNALVVRELVRPFRVTDQQFKDALVSFTPLRHRMQFVATKSSRTYIDDAIGMTPESTLASMAAVQEKYGPIGCLLLGGQDRNYDFGPLMTAVVAAKIPALVLFPNTANKMTDAMPSEYKPVILRAKTMLEAVQFASTQAPHGTVVLLSTAAPSYSIWKDFEEKGEQFHTAVANLP